MAKAAAVAGVSFDRMKEIMLNRGIQPHLGPESIDEACHEMDVIEQNTMHAMAVITNTTVISNHLALSKADTILQHMVHGGYRSPIASLNEIIHNF